MVQFCLTIVGLQKADVLSNLKYNSQQIPNFKYFLSRLAVVFAQAIEARH